MIDLRAIKAAVNQHGPVVRVVTADVKGSGPREVGAAMLVWATGQSGTIGGGTLEHQATEAARRQLEQGQMARHTHHPLGPSLGQCCGGAVSLVSEVYTPQILANLPTDSPFARRVSGDAEMPLSIRSTLAKARAEGLLPETTLKDGWFIEPIAQSLRPLWVWGAGHVGRAVVRTLAPLSDFEITWIDTAEDRFPDTIPENVTQLVGQAPARLVPHVPSDAHHVILTYSHALDLELCHQLLTHSHRFVGLIGSKTKWARFQKRLSELGHSTNQISRITCPIGDPLMGKHPQAIAIGVAAKLLSLQEEQITRRDRTA